MKNIASIGKIFVLMVVISSTVIAQRTSSAIQTVTFGVNRSYRSSLNSLSLVQGAVHSPRGSQMNVLQNDVSTGLTKVTVTAPSVLPGSDASMTALQSSPQPSVPETAHAGSVSHMSTPRRNTSDIQLDVRSILISKEWSTFDRTPLVVTITE
jgi:hypothetical protein